MYGENGLFAFELKSRRSISAKDFSGLKAFKKDYPIAHCYLVYTGEHKERHEDGMLALPITQALIGLPSILGQEKPIIGKQNR